MNKEKIIIDSNLSSSFSLKDVLKYKGLLNNLVKRDFLVRYKQAHIGIAWALIKPLISILIFGYIASKISSGQSNADSFLNVAAGLLLWQLFASVFSEVSGSIVNNSNLFSKVYFPKIIIPISTIMVCLVDFFISVLILIVLFFIAGKTVHWQAIFAPLFIILTVINGFGIGLFFATLYVKYRDMRFIVSIIIQFGMYASPVIFSSSFYLDRLGSVSKFLEWLYCLNPMVGAIDGFRYCLFGTEAFSNVYLFATSICVSFIFLFLGTKFFYKFERNFVDFI